MWYLIAFYVAAAAFTYGWIRLMVRGLDLSSVAEETERNRSVSVVLSVLWPITWVTVLYSLAAKP